MEVTTVGSDVGAISWREAMENRALLGAMKGDGTGE